MEKRDTIGSPDKVEKKETLGQVVNKLLEKQDNYPMTVTEIIEESKVQYWQEAEKQLAVGKKRFNKSFYIEMCQKYEKLFGGIVKPRWLGITRESCPTPMFEQSCFFYNKVDDYLEYMWTIPDMHTCCYLVENSLSIPQEQHELLQYALDFKDGTLLKLCKKLNGEYAGQIIVN